MSYIKSSILVVCVNECIDLFQSMHMHYGHYVDGADE